MLKNNLQYSHIFSLIFLLITGCGSASVLDIYGSISGRVINEGANAEPIDGAKCSIKNTEKYANSNAEGKFIINQLKKGNYKVNCTYTKFGSVFSNTIDVIVEAGKNTDVGDIKILMFFLHFS